MSTQVVKIENFDIKNLRLSPVKANKRGGKVVYINYIYSVGEDPKKLRIQFPKMKTPFSISGWSPESAGAKGLDSSRPNEISTDSIELAFEDNNSENLKKIEEFENYIFEHAFKNCKEMFGKNLEKVVVKSNFTQSIRYSIDKETDLRNDKYPPRLKGKLTKDDSGQYLTKFYDSNKKQIDVNFENFNEHIPKMSDCVSIFECSTIWVVNGKFGVSFRPVQLKVYKNETTLNDYAFVDEDSENEYTDSYEETGSEEVGNLQEKVKDVNLEGLQDNEINFLDELDQDNSITKEKKSKKKTV